MISVTVEITGDKEFIAKLDKLQSTLTDWGSALGKIGRGLVSYYENEVFNSQGGALGHKWAALAPGTVAFKKKHYRTYSSVPLMETGTMRTSFVPEHTKTSLEIKNTASYFVYHQSSAPRHKLPRRQMMGINPTIKNTIKQIITQDIHEKVGRL